MPSKAKKAQEKESKKAAQKKKEKLLDDKTFGLKNKNKSSKVQAYVKSTERSILNAGTDARTRQMDAQKKEQAKARKALKKAKEAEQAALFGEALMAVSKKGPKFGAKAGKVEAKGRDGGDENEKKGGTSRAMKMMFQMDAQEMEDKLREDPNYVPTLEDEVESQRQKKLRELKASGVKGTPVTQETFKVWQDKKRKRKEAATKKMVEKEMKKKKGGKGLSVLSGRELYNYKKDLFQDQEGDDGGDNVVDVNAAAEVALKVEQDLFLEGDDDLDDLED
uniref:ZC3H15/TMA46 family C-terminal domain-containing protein n=2 Tax=Skeletonema marinoi TaxID=267567 RepID=A0A6T7LTW9_9STRA|mmetsp:Transcript_26604/g.39585  ORF Transcript_26604/g.39585 Transcript_26604/m.39585 type:complete len:278 (-) Transcript_26604:101-934(-)